MASYVYRSPLYLLLVITFLIAGAAFGRCTTGAPTANVGMEYVDICDRENNCKKFSRLVMGTDHLVQANWVTEGQQEISDDELHAILDEAIELGINAFDTSPIYVGDIENKLGKWLVCAGTSTNGLVSGRPHNNSSATENRRLTCAVPIADE